MAHFNTGRKQSPEWVAKRVAKQLGQKRTVEFRKEQSKRKKYFYKNGGTHSGLGKHRTEETKKKLSEATKKQWQDGQFGRGEKSHAWKGGVTPINKAVRASKEYALWRTSVFIRDNRACMWCGSKKDIEADHIKPFAYYPE